MPSGLSCVQLVTLLSALLLCCLKFLHGHQGTPQALLGCFGSGVKNFYLQEVLFSLYCLSLSFVRFLYYLAPGSRPRQLFTGVQWWCPVFYAFVNAVMKPNIIFC